jgi:phosphoribosylanthranilate isomerase
MQVWSVLRVAEEKHLERLDELAAGATVVLVEPWVEGAHGGTGTALPLELAALARERLSGARMALAGGLRPETVERAIALVRPDVVDVSSGVESAPGLKDADLLARFLEVTRDARPRG